MINFFYKNNNLMIEKSDKTSILFDFNQEKILLDNFNVTFPGEYEKSGILLEVKEITKKLYYNFLIDGKHLVIITDDNIELNEEIIDFFGDIDILIIKGTKKAVKIFENIETKLVIPYGEGKDLFLNLLGQSIEEIQNFKLKGDLPIDKTDFINLKN